MTPNLNALDNAVPRSGILGSHRNSMYLVKRFFHRVLPVMVVAVLALLSQVYALADGNCGNYLTTVNGCFLGRQGVVITLGRADGLIGDLYIQASIPANGQPAQFSWGTSASVTSWLNVQEADGTMTVTSALTLIGAGGGAAGWIYPGQKVWWQIRLQGWETLQKNETKDVVFWFGLGLVNLSVLDGLAVPSAVTLSIK